MEQLLERLAHNDHPFGVVARFYGEVSPPGLDGRRFRFKVTNGITWHFLDAQLSGSEGGVLGAEFDTATLEAAVERKAGNYPREVRLAAMVADAKAREGGLTLRGEDLRS